MIVVDKKEAMGTQERLSARLFGKNPLSRKKKVFAIIGAQCIVAASLCLFWTDFEPASHFRGIQRKLCEEYADHRALSAANFPSAYLHRILSCDVPYDTEDGMGYLRYPVVLHPTDPNAVPPPHDPSNIGYVLLFTECPQHPSTGSSVDSTTFYDAFAVAKHFVCQSSADSGDEVPASNYSHTMYAFVHPDAMACTGTDGNTFDTVSALAEIGYHVNIYGEAVSSAHVPGRGQEDFKDLVALHALTLTHHDMIAIIDPTTMIRQPIDEVFDDLKSDPNAKAAYSTDPVTSLVDTTFIVFKTSIAEFDAIVDVIKTTDFDLSFGYIDTGICAGVNGKVLSCLLTQYYEGLFNEAMTFDRCVYNNGAGPACKSRAIETIKIARASDTCTQPWNCGLAGASWDAQTENLCRTFLNDWSVKRAGFEDFHWHKPDKVQRTGTYHADVSSPSN